MSASIYDPATKTLVPFAGTSISMMSELSDVELSAPSNGQVLRYDSSNQAWGNADNVSDVSVTPVLSSGTKIATVTVDGSSTDLYAPSGGGSTGGGHTIEDAEGTDLTQRDTLQFGEGFKAEDDDTNEKTVISPDVMQSGDMDDVITPLPSVQPRYQKYSTEEQIVGEWIDGKPLYEKTITFTAPTVTTAGQYVTAYVNYNVPTIDTKFISEAFLIDGDNISRPLIYILNAGSQIKVSLTATQIQIVSGIVEYSGQPMYVTMRYTKSE